MLLLDIICRGLEVGASDEKIRQVVHTLYPEATDEEIGAAYLQAADMLEERAAGDLAKAEEHRRQAERNHEILAECTEIALETGLPLRPDTVVSDFVRKAAAMGNSRATVLLGKLPGAGRAPRRAGTMVSQPLLWSFTLRLPPRLLITSSTHWCQKHNLSRVEWGSGLSCVPTLST